VKNRQIDKVKTKKYKSICETQNRFIFFGFIFSEQAKQKLMKQQTYANVGKEQFLPSPWHPRGKA
jgi:hypothetical protein